MKAGELRVLAVKVAEELAKLTGQTWEVRPRKDSDNPRDHDDRIDIQCGPDAERYITMSQTPEGAYSYGKYDPKINVSGNLPLYRGTRYPSDYQLKAKELAEPEWIGVAESRPPATIAKDIKRRLVAPYLAAFDLGRELIAGFHEADAAYEDFSTDLRDNFWLVPSGREHRNHSYRMNLTNGFGTPEIKVNSVESVTIELSLKPEAARKVLGFLADVGKPKLCRKCRSVVTMKDRCTDEVCDYRRMGQDQVIREIPAADLADGDVFEWDLKDDNVRPDEDEGNRHRAFKVERKGKKVMVTIHVWGFGFMHRSLIPRVIEIPADAKIVTIVEG